MHIKLLAQQQQQMIEQHKRTTRGSCHFGLQRDVFEGIAVAPVDPPGRVLPGNITR